MSRLLPAAVLILGPLLVAATTTVTTTTPAPVITVPPVGGAVACDRFASVSGSDAAAGSSSAPFRSVAKLWGSLAAGQTGCLFGGTYAGAVSLSRGGVAGSPITLRSVPGQRAKLTGVLSISDSANDVTIADLDLDARAVSDAPTVQVNGDRVRFENDDVTNEHTGICIILGGGFERYGRAEDAVINGNRIHDCGVLPATNRHHGIYVEGADNTVITNNYIYNNADFGVHFYPDSNGAYVVHNVIDGNGEGVIFAERARGSYSRAYASDNNIVEFNIITNSKIRANVESSWGSRRGTGNVLRSNCVSGGHRGNIDRSNRGFVSTQNVHASPTFVDRRAGDFTIAKAGACAGMGPEAVGAA